MIARIILERRSEATESKDLNSQRSQRIKVVETIRLFVKCVEKMRKLNDCRLYLVVSEECAKNRCVVDLVRDALDAGVDMLQMREKSKDKEELIKLGKKFSLLCREKNKIFIVNDDPVLANEVNADGVHVGQEDTKKFPFSKIRNIIGREKILGISTHSFEQFREANKSDVDYIAFGPIFPTQTKNYHIGIDDIEKILKVATKPVFFIGGINLSNIDLVLTKGVRNIALIRGILEADNIKTATCAFREKLKK